MSRLSVNEVVEGRVKNGFDYELQVWVKDYIVQHCGHHPAEVFTVAHCCNGSRYAGQDIREVIV